MGYSIPEQTAEYLATWPPRARGLFEELLEDARSDLQRELILRATAAGHTPAEIHAFADELRPLSDEEAFERCSLEDGAPKDYTVSQLLRAEADPLFAFELRGGVLEPREDQDDSSGSPRQAAKQVEHAANDSLAAGLAGKKRSSFDAQSFDLRSRSRGLSEAVRSRPLGTVKKDTVVETRLLESLLGEATRELSIFWKEHDVDVPSGLTMADALAAAGVALSRGLPVPCAIGPAAGINSRHIVLLQRHVVGKVRAWQLYDPFSSELVWANEGDLMSGAELPFANKRDRCITRVVLPQRLRVP